MKAFELMGSITIDGKGAVNALDDVEKKGGKVAKFLGKTALAITGLAAVGAAALGKAVVSAYADYEQLVGGVDTLFKDSSKLVQSYAENAYKTAGMSANQYMETVTGFSASLIQSLGGDTEKAAKYADMAITDMSDNANKMGSDISSIQNAYQGFAKQNYTMLDNLKLGYGGTKEEMQRLLDDAEKLSGIEYDISSYADIVDAIHVVQDEMEITGTTAKEASSTITGSINTMKGAFTNLIAGMGNPSADVEKLANDLVDSFLSVVTNIKPVIDRLVTVLPVVADALLKAFVDLLPTLLTNITPVIDQLITVVPVVVDALLKAFIDLLPTLLTTAMGLVQQIMSTVLGVDLSGVFPLLSDLIMTLIPMALDLLGKLLPIFAMLLESLLPFAIELLDMLLPPVMQILDLLLPLITSILEPLLPLLEPILALIQPLIDILMILLEPLIQLLDFILPPLIEFIALFVGKHLTQLGNAFKEIASVVSGVIDGFKKDFGGWKNIFTSLMTFINDKFITPFTKAFQKVGDFFADVFKGIGKAFKAPINTLIDGMNGFIRGLNKLKIPDWVPVVGGKGLNLPTLSRLQVGIDYVPSDDYPAMLHRGERVLTAAEARAADGRGGTSGQTVIVNINGNSAQAGRELLELIQAGYLQQSFGRSGAYGV